MVNSTYFFKVFLPR